MLGYTASFESAAKAQEAADHLPAAGVKAGHILILDSIETFEKNWSAGLRDGYLKSPGEPTYRRTIEGGGAVMAFLVNVGMAWKPFEAIEAAGGTVHGNFTAYRQEFLTGWLGPLAWDIKPFAKIEDRRWTNMFTEATFSPTDKLWTNIFTPKDKLWTGIFKPLNKLWTGEHLGGRDKDV
ncbi:MAG: hypothetical protein AAF447_09480 [Myxococcota bacterium]